MIDQIKRHAGSLTVLIILLLALYWGSRRIRTVPNFLD